MGASSQQASPAGVVDPTLLNKAVSALLKHHTSSSNSNQLLDDELDIQVQFTLARIPGKPSPKPIRIDIPHPLIKIGENNDVALEEADVCLIVKDESKPAIQEMISRFPNELSSIKKVLTLSSLRSKHKSFSQKRELLNRYDIFMADDRILPMLMKGLGTKFFEKKKQPVPVNICREEALPFAVAKCLRGTFVCLSGGTCVTVKAGNTSMTANNLQSNVQSICQQVPLKVPRKWANIKSISIKTTSSVSLPIYNKTLEELEEIKNMADIIGATNAVNDGKEDMKDEESRLAEKKRRQELAKSPLARALKKQKNAEKEEEKEKPKSSKKKRKESVDDDEVAVEEETVSKTKSSKKKRKESVDEDQTVDETAAKTPKSSKKKRKESVDEEDTVLKTPKEKKAKSAKKSKQQEEEDPKSTKKTRAEEDAPFIPSKKFTGSKSGYVFRKDKQGLGYYRDVLPVVDKAYLAKLKSGKGGGGRKSISHTPKKRKSNSRRSY